MNLDGEFGALVDKCGGDVPQFLNQVFGYLARKTDFFDARPRDQSKQVLLEEHERIFNRVELPNKEGAAEILFNSFLCPIDDFVVTGKREHLLNVHRLDNEKTKELEQSGKFTPEYFTTQAQDFSSLMASGKDFEHHYLAEFNDMWQKIGVGGGIGTNYFLVDFKSFVSGMPFDEFLKILKYDGMTTNQKGFDSRLSGHKLKARKNEKNRAVDFKGIENLLITLRKDKTSNHRFVPLLENVPVNMVTGIEHCTTTALKKLGSPIVNINLPHVAEDDRVREKSPEFCLFWGVFLLHKFHAEFLKHFNGKMKGHSIHDEDLIVSDKIHQHWKNEEVKPLTEALIAKFMQDVEGATQSNKKVSQNVANSISAIAAVVLEDKQATATANKYKINNKTFSKQRLRFLFCAKKVLGDGALPDKTAKLLREHADNLELVVKRCGYKTITQAEFEKQTKASATKKSTPKANSSKKVESIKDEGSDDESSTSTPVRKPVERKSTARQKPQYARNLPIQFS